MKRINRVSLLVVLIFALAAPAFAGNVLSDGSTAEGGDSDTVSKPDDKDSSDWIMIIVAGIITYIRRPAT